jgi:hypothetical protein
VESEVSAKGGRSMAIRIYEGPPVVLWAFPPEDKPFISMDFSGEGDMDAEIAIFDEFHLVDKIKRKSP